MATTIVGTLPVNHFVDPNGSLSVDVPLQIPPSKMAPKVSLSYHSAANTVSAIGMGWVLKGASLIERVPATKAQDGFRGVVNYDEEDRFSLDGQRLIHIGGNEYRYEIEQWSKIIAQGTDQANPDSWIEYLPDGSRRLFGATQDSNIKALGHTATRVWAVSEHFDAFSNHITYTYVNDTLNGSFYLEQLEYGGNHNLNMAHQRRLLFAYEVRPDIRTAYLGGYKICVDKRLSSVASHVHQKLVHRHLLQYDEAPVTGNSRLISLTLLDASGSAVRPLEFDWVSGNPAIFDNPGPSTAIKVGDDAAQIMALDVSATGRSDIVILSKKIEELNLAVHTADGNGQISSEPISTLFGLPYPTQLIPLDVNGDGRTDLLHILSTTKSHILTVLLSTPDGYQPQNPVEFDPGYVGGYFRSGDFEGNGHVGLVYFYQRIVAGRIQIMFRQFVSDGKIYNPLPPAEGPMDVSLDDAKVVIGDLNGNGAQDIFLISAQVLDGNSVCRISFIESQDGTLGYRQHDGIAEAGLTVLWSESNSFIPYPTDEDGKTSLLVASRSMAGKLQLELLRSTGPSLLPPPQRIETALAYNGNLTLAKTSSTYSIDLVNTFERTTGNPPCTDVHVLRFCNGTFDVIQGVTQPGDLSSFVAWADLRGIGRADCLLNTRHTNGSIAIRPMLCSSSQPGDYLSGFRNGLGAVISVIYAPLSDPETYSTDGASSAPLAATNAMARNVSLTASLSSSNPEISAMTHSRSQLVYFPAWVVRQVIVVPSAKHPDVVARSDYTYLNARIDFDGRGWLGFEKMTKIDQVLGTSDSTWYSQEFPFLGQVMSTTRSKTMGDDQADQLLQDKKYSWGKTQCNDGGISSWWPAWINWAIFWRFITFNLYQNIKRNRNTKVKPSRYSIQLSALHETNYEDGHQSYDADVAYAYDAFDNITELSINSLQKNLLIQATYDNHLDPWVIGNKTCEIVKQNDAILKQAKYDHIPGTQITRQIVSWVDSSTWSTQAFEFDGAGNETVIQGPGLAQRTLTYDETLSFVTSAATLVDPNESPLVETAVFGLEHGKPLLITDPNGLITSLTYDVLGRMQETSKGENVSEMTVVSKQAFLLESADFLRVTQARIDWASDNGWAITKCHLDGLDRVWRTERPSADDPAVLIYSDVEYDGAGRVAARSRDYLPGSLPLFTQYTYDSDSRVILQTLPPADTDVSPIAITSRYEFASGLATCIETQSDGITATDQTSSREIQYLPNAEPSAGHFVKPFVVTSTNELQQSVQTTFDGLGRPISVQDPGGNQLSLSWDGLSRPVQRRLSQSDSDGTTREISHFSVQYDDDQCEKTVRNELAGTEVVTKSDYAQRPIYKVTAEETLTYKYDTGGDYSKERLVSVASSNGTTHLYDYDLHGRLISTSLSLDGLVFNTAYKWAPSGALKSIENPDGTIINRSFHVNGESVDRMELIDVSDTTRAWISFSSYDIFSRPLVCEFGNGIVSDASTADIGTIVSTSLSKGADLLHHQDWEIDAFSRISKYEINHKGETATRTLQYNTAGQLLQRVSESLSDNLSESETFSYDRCGNLATKNGQTFVNNGWQLSSVTNPEGTVEHSFDYSIDGNMTSKYDEIAKEATTMVYDIEGRLVQLNQTSFLYDHGGNLIKTVHPNGDVTIYPSQSYEINISSSGLKTHTSYLTHGYRRASLSTEEDSGAKSVGPSTVYYFHNDHLGSTIAVSNENGEIITQYEYDAYGKATVNGPDVARYKFSGKEQFGGLYYFGARFYDPDIGRFLTLDNYPVNLENITPSTFNMYSFSRNDPMNYIDLNGNVPWWHWIVDAVLIIAGAALTIATGGAAAPLLAITLGAASGALLGAGLGGLMSDWSAQINGTNDDAAWAMQLGLGAAFGAVSGGAGAALDLVYPAVSLFQVAASQGALGAKVVGGFAVRTTVRLGVGAGIDTGLSVLQKVTENAMSGKPLNEGLGEAAAMGALTATATNGTFGTLDFVAPVKGSGLQRRFWKDRDWKVYRLAHQEKLAGLGDSSRSVAYPLRQTGMDVGHFRAVEYGSSSKHLPVSEVTSL